MSEHALARLDVARRRQSRAPRSVLVMLTAMACALLMAGCSGSSQHGDALSTVLGSRSGDAQGKQVRQWPKSVTKTPINLSQDAGSGTSSGTAQDDTAAGSAALIGLDCVSPTFCMEVNYDFKQNATAYVYNGSSWKQTPLGGNDPIGELTCATANFCIGIPWPDGTPADHGGYIVWNGHRWSKQKSAGDVGGINSISCTSPTYCAATTEDGVLTFNGTSWGLPQDVLGSDHYAEKIRCIKRNHCVIAAGSADDNSDTLYDFNGSAASDAGTPFDDRTVNELSCAKSGACAVKGGGDPDEIAFRKGPSSNWQTPTKAAGGPIACGSGDSARTTCFNISANGAGAVHTSGQVWKAAPMPKAPTSGDADPDENQYNSQGEEEDLMLHEVQVVSCASDTWCMALDIANGGVYQAIAKP